MRLRNSKLDQILASVASLATRAIWSGWILLVALVSTGVPLAVVGLFVPWLVVPATLTAGVLISRLVARHLVVDALRGRSAVVSFLLAVAVVSISTIGNLAYSGQHHATNRDPGVYLETGLWLAEHGSLEVDGRQGPFLALDELAGGGLGFEEIDDDSGRLHPQFGHAMAVVIAFGSWLMGVVGATRVPALLMALALMLWWFALKALTNPPWATIGVTALSLNLVMIHVARDTFSEPLAFALIAGAVVLLSSSTSRASWMLAGWAVGISVSARVDMAVVVFGAMLLAAAGRGSRKTTTPLFIVTTTVAGGFALLDLSLRSPEYLSDRWDALLPVIGATIVAAGVALSIGRLQKLLARVNVPRLMDAVRPAVRVLGIVTIVSGSVYALILRPNMVEQHSGFSGHIAGLQARDGLSIDATRTYGEQAAVWLTWYMGIPAVLLAVAGAAIAWTMATDRRPSALLPTLSLMAPLTILYLQRPRITGDQIWAVRRFVPTAIPLIILLASLACLRLLAWLNGRIGQRRTLMAHAALAGLLIVPAAMTTLPFRAERTMLWPTHRITELCDLLGPDSAVLVSNEQLLGDHLIRTVARTCSIPTARGNISEVELANLSTDWRSEGRRLVVIAYSGEAIPNATRVTNFAMPQQLLEQAVERSPGTIESGTRQITIWDATTDAE